MTAEAVRVAPDRPAARRPTVVVVDDHSLVADTVALALRERGIAVTAAEPAAFIERIDQEAPPGGLVLLDLDLGAGRDGLELVPTLRRVGWRVLMFTATRNQTRLALAVAAGAVGWVCKSSPFDELVQAVVRAAAGQPLLSVGEHTRLLAVARTAGAAARQERERWQRLTPREREVVSRIVAGRRPALIAQEFVVSVATVRSQIRSILAKLEVSSQLEVAALVRRHERC
jgi:two-component system nitrate/nitrite response regulator NarL